jgi:branched-chain amino acid transport system permease protein
MLKLLKKYEGDGMRTVYRIMKKYSLLFIGIVLLLIPSISSQYGFYVLQRGVQNAIHVLGLLILIGYSGMLSLGSAALIATGAYTYAILLTRLGMNCWLGFALAVVFTTVFGTSLALPSFRLAGPFLVVTTVGFGEIVRIVLLNMEKLTGGAYGLSGYATLLPDQKKVYYLMVVTLILVALATHRIGFSRLGLALKALKVDQMAAEVMGVDIRKAKIVSFALSAMLAGISGVFLANLTGYISPDMFTSAESTTYLLMVVMGGMSSVVGTIISSIIVTVLPELLRFLSSSRLLVYSLVLLIYLRTKYVRIPWIPDSLANVFRRRRIDCGPSSKGE